MGFLRPRLPHLQAARATVSRDPGDARFRPRGPAGSAGGRALGASAGRDAAGDARRHSRGRNVRRSRRDCLSRRANLVGVASLRSGPVAVRPPVARGRLRVVCCAPALLGGWLRFASTTSSRTVHASVTNMPGTFPEGWKQAADACRSKIFRGRPSHNL